MRFIRSAHFIPVLHIIIWTLLLTIPSMAFWNHTWIGLPQSFFLITTIYHIGLFYFNAYFLFPRLMTKNWWWLYIVAIAGIVRLSYSAKVYILQLDPNFNLTDINKRVIFFSLLPLLIASIFYRIISDRIRFERLEKEAKAQRMDAELKFLRSQISPHFLFNMMANMVSLARKKSELLEPSLIRLSDLLRYMLYDSTKDKITLSSEFDNVKNYVSLQQLRFGDEVNVNLNIDNASPESLIEPMLLVPFIENGFKHGVGLLKEPVIDIRLAVKDNILHFDMTNPFNASDLSKDGNSGIGLANVKNRLALLYANKYELQIIDSNNIFSVHLQLNLS